MHFAKKKIAQIYQLEEVTELQNAAGETSLSMNELIADHAKVLFLSNLQCQ